jgi:hypothetical protein
MVLLFESPPQKITHILNGHKHEQNKYSLLLVGSLYP